MSSFTTSAFVANGDFSAETRKHPAMVFGEAATRNFDSRNHSNIAEWLTSDFTVVQPNGTPSTGNPSQAFESAKQVYDKLFTAYRHVPSSAVVVDMENGYKVMSHAFLYANLLAVSALNPMKVAGPEGSSWDIAIPVFSEVDVVKDTNAKHQGMLVKQMKFVMDQNELSKELKTKGLSLPSFFRCRKSVITKNSESSIPFAWCEKLVIFRRVL